MTLTTHIDRQELIGYLPHKGKMFLLDRVLSYELSHPTHLVSESDIAESSIFYDSGLSGIPVWVAFEYMAQSIAALSGIDAKVENSGAEPKIGMIMGVRDFKAEIDCLPTGSTVRTEVSEVFRDGPVVSFECGLFFEGRKVVRATLNAIEVDDHRTLLQGRKT
jgi:predicted hotdog family 3-hydroxylacyl-ACP dehydratase